MTGFGRALIKRFSAAGRGRLLFGMRVRRYAFIVGGTNNFATVVLGFDDIGVGLRKNDVVTIDRLIGLGNIEIVGGPQLIIAVSARALPGHMNFVSHIPSPPLLPLVKPANGSEQSFRISKQAADFCGK